MNITQAFKMSMQSIFGNKVRSFLTMLGIIIGVGAVMIMVAVVQGGNQEMQKMYEAQGVNKISVNASQWNGQDVTDQLYDYCLTLDDFVLGVTPSSTHWGPMKYMTSNTENNTDMYLQIYYGSDQFSICNNNTIEKGRDISYLDVEKYRQVVVLGSKLAEYLFQTQDPVGKDVTISGQTFQVVGVYGKNSPGTNAWMDQMDYFAVVPHTTSRLLDGRTTMDQFIVKAKSSQATTEAITRISGFLSGVIDTNSGYYDVWSDNTWQESSQEGNNLMSMILGGIAGISLLVGGIGIMNIMLVTVSERTREIGIRKAIGGSRRSIITQFLIEASVICGMGGIFGVILGYLGTIVAGKLILDTFLLPSLPLTIGSMTFSVILGIGFGLYPAVKASGLQPVDALRAD